MSLKSLSLNKQPESYPEASSLKPLSSETSALLEDILNKELHLRVKATGKSMAPFLHGGEILTIKKVPGSSLHIGDLIFFKTADGFPLLHRIVKKQSMGDMFLFQTKGDAVSTPDEPVRERDILGKVCRIERTNSDCREKHVDMELPVWKVMNFSLALVSVGKGKIASHPALAGLLRRIKKAFI